jgi:hypothetical protein
MRHRHHARLAKTLLAFFGLSAALAAQEKVAVDPELTIHAEAKQRAEWANEWLSSDDPQRIAWGAWLARRDHQTALVPVLIEKVEEYQPNEEFSFQTVERDRHDALLVVLDALIELRAPVPVQAARKLYPEFAAQSIILLVRSPEDAQSSALDIFHIAEANWTWLAAGNLLLKNRTPGFAALLLTQFTEHMEVSVMESGFGRAGGVGGGGSECGFSPGGPKAGWPPVGLYFLNQFPERLSYSATFLIGGETPVYYWRNEPGNYDNPTASPGACDDGNRDEYRAQYLNKLMDPWSPRIKLEAYPRTTIEWKGEADYRQQLNRIAEEQRTAFQRGIAFLQDTAQVLTPSEAAPLKLRLEFVIRDDRSRQSIPLPAISERDTTVLVKTAFSKPLY